eukprot:4450880-Amphidinium_carterae.1
MALRALVMGGEHVKFESSEPALQSHNLQAMQGRSQQEGTHQESFRAESAWSNLHMICRKVQPSGVGISSAIFPDAVPQT